MHLEQMHLLLTYLLLSTLAPPPADFSGTWVFSEVRPGPPGVRDGSNQSGVVGLRPADVVITQTATTLVTETRPLDTVIRCTFNLTGAESTNHSGAVTFVTRTRWAGATLVTEGSKSQVTSQGYAEWKWKEIRSLDGQGRMLVETHHTATDGTVTSATQVWTRKAR